MSNKTEKATPRRLRKAREEGDSGVSSHLSQSIAFVAAALLVPLVLADTWATAAGMLRHALMLGPSFSWEHLLAVFFRLSLPALVVSAVVGTGLTLAQTSGVFAPGRIVPKAERLDVFRGFRNLVSLQRLVTVVRSLAYTSIVSWMATRALLSNAHSLVAFGSASILAAIGQIGLPLLRNAAILGLAFGFVDLWTTLRARDARLKMTKDEVRREHRESEGDPHLKAARRRAHQEVLTQVILSDVRKASVIVINPTHLACALRYDEAGGDVAPVIVATGAGDLARRIVAEAYAQGIPVLQNIPVARAIYDLELGNEIPPELYEAVAEILRLAMEEERLSFDTAEAASNAQQKDARIPSNGLRG